MARINKAIELLAQGLPVFYVNTGDLTFENGKRMAGTWADMIRLDLEHHPFDPAGIGEFMRGLIAGGPTASGHRTPAVIAELPTDGTDEPVMRANAWMIKQSLAQGIHGFLLCHAETPGAARVLVESARFSHQFMGVGPNLGIGRRGNGAQTIAAPMWGLSTTEYFRRADVWPINPDGELLLGLKIENPRAVANVDQSLAVPGIGFAEWGPGDNGMALGDPEAHDPPYSPAMAAIRERVRTACLAHNVFFLDLMAPNEIEKRIDEGVMIGNASSAEVAERARAYARKRRAADKLR